MKKTIMAVAIVLCAGLLMADIIPVYAWPRVIQTAQKQIINWIASNLQVS